MNIKATRKTASAVSIKTLEIVLQKCLEDSNEGKDRGKSIVFNQQKGKAGVEKERTMFRIACMNKKSLTGEIQWPGEARFVWDNTFMVKIIEILYGLGVQLYGLTDAQAEDYVTLPNLLFSKQDIKSMSQAQQGEFLSSFRKSLFDLSDNIARPPAANKERTDLSRQQLVDLTEADSMAKAAKQKVKEQDAAKANARAFAETSLMERGNGGKRKSRDEEEEEQEEEEQEPGDADDYGAAKSAHNPNPVPTAMQSKTNPAVPVAVSAKKAKRSGNIDEDGINLGMQSFSRSLEDANEERKYERAQREAKLAKEEADQAGSAFLHLLIRYQASKEMLQTVIGRDSNCDELEASDLKFIDSDELDSVIEALPGSFTQRQARDKLKTVLKHYPRARED